MSVLMFEPSIELSAEEWGVLLNSNPSKEVSFKFRAMVGEKVEHELKLKPERQGQRISKLKAGEWSCLCLWRLWQALSFMPNM